MELYTALTLFMLVTEGTPLQLGNVEFWIDPNGPWAGQLSFSIPTGQWSPNAMGESVAQLAKIHPEVWGIVSKYAVAAD